MISASDSTPNSGYKHITPEQVEILKKTRVAAEDFVKMLGGDTKNPPPKQALSLMVGCYLDFHKKEALDWAYEMGEALNLELPPRK